jgi:hypothetical protein
VSRRGAENAEHESLFVRILHYASGLREVTHVGSGRLHAHGDFFWQS